MYADETSITFAGSDVDEINSCINLDLERIRVWLAANKLTLNTSSNQRLVECVRQDTRKDSEARGAEAHGMALTSFAPETFSGGAKLPTSYSP